MPGSTGHTLFDTAIGRCGMAWGPAGISGVQLPEPTEEGTRQRLLRHLPAPVPETEPPPMVQSAITELKAALRGERPADLRHIPLDFSRLTPFLQRVYERARAIPPGQVLTYGEFAAELGNPQLARAIGQAMGANPFAPVVPCHRVLAAGGQPGGFSASGGAITKWQLLEIEGYRPGGASLFD